MNVSHDSRRNRDVVNILLLHENLFGLVTEILDILLRYDLARLERLDGLVQVHETHVSKLLRSRKGLFFQSGDYRSVSPASTTFLRRDR